MKELCWRLAGADSSILRSSGAESQRNFYVIGLLYAVVNSFILTALCGLFLGLFNNWLIAICCGLIFTFLLSNIYRLNMMSLEPPTLRGHTTLSGNITSYSLRFFIISFFAFFIAKCLETVLLGWMVEAYIHKGPNEHPFLKELFALNRMYPSIWLITATIFFIFLLPVILKFQLTRSHEYYSLKSTRDSRVVMAHYEEFRAVLVAKQAAAYEGYTKENRPAVPDFEDRTANYTDPPFNTRRKSDDTELQSNDDFINLSDWN